MITFSQLGKMGRTANMLFQMAAVIGAAEKYQDRYFFPHWQYEGCFNLKGCFNFVQPRIPLRTRKYSEPFFQYQPIPSFSKNEIFDITGYFQSYLYWEHCQDKIRNFFTPNHQLNFDFTDTTSIHIRRTDYLPIQDCHPVQPMSYYQQAIEICNTSRYLVFSDDIDWCKENFKGDQFTIMEGNSPTVDLLMQSRCSNNIIANSSFSWWGAWLNTNPNKQVVAPNHWFGSKLSHNTQDLCPPNWIKI